MGGARLAQLAAGVDEGFREDNQATADIGVRRSDDDVAGYAPGSRDHTVGRADELTGLDGRDGAGWFNRGILKDGGPNARMFTCGSPAIPQLAYSLWIPETNFSRRCCARFGYELGSIYEILPFHGRQMIKIASLSAFFPWQPDVSLERFAMQHVCEHVRDGCSSVPGRSGSKTLQRNLPCRLPSSDCSNPRTLPTRQSLR